MSFFSNMRVGTKLILGFLTVALLGAIVGGVGVYSLSQVNKKADNMYRYETLGVQHIAEAKSQLISISTELRNVFLAPEQFGRDRAIKRIGELFLALDGSLASAAKSFTTDEGRAYLENISSTSQHYKRSINSVLSRLHEQPYFEPSPLVQEILDSAVPLAARLDKVTDQAIEQKVGVARSYNRQIASDFITVRNGLITIIIIATLVAIFLGLFLTRGLIRQLGGEPADVSTIADAISHGNLHNHIDVSRALEGSVMHSMEAMQNALRETVINVRTSSDSIATGSSQIAAGNMDLSQRTEEQAANVTETASAMEEITSTLRTNADSAKEATELAAVVRNTAVAGQNAAKDVELSMADMRSASEQIVNIINVIDSIAFQTNILALNAAVESARAGEAGRGFAVVASEVRTLAQRSASAAQDIKHLIEDSVSKVSQGNEKARLAGSTIQTMVEQVNQVATLIDEISAATLEQSMGVEQVNQAIGQLEEVTQQNAALVEQSAVAAASLNDQAAHLVDIVRIFDLDGDAIEVSAIERQNYGSASSVQTLAAKQHLLGS